MKQWRWEEDGHTMNPIISETMLAEDWREGADRRQWHRRMNRASCPPSSASADGPRNIRIGAAEPP
jgi:hypothetical protein